ncbi:MAG: SAM-dependent methyltransferase [Rhizobiaceae bacterium]|nr:SAM-dependent methyltransferase [Rhizobiaceae bacterium]MCV0408005.1 SAM-dependent methyltransferase [Rhizobiaceae bacterium]
MSTLAEARELYARLMAAASGSSDPRLQRIFELVPREAFLPPGPWRIIGSHGVVLTPSANPIHLQQNVLVALDASRGINTGEPFLHAAWIGQVAPQPGETVVHIGAGGGYYSAILGMLVLPDGSVVAYEIEPELATAARTNLEPFENVTLVEANATSVPVGPADIIYVNAGLAEPPLAWLDALKPEGRMVFPWRPSESVGLSLLVRREAVGLSCRAFSGAWFIPLAGEAGAIVGEAPSLAEARAVRSLWRVSERAPDDSAVAVGRQVWFSRAAP